jgi:hypothetical protein
MYLMFNDFAEPGDYVVNKHTGEIEQARWVDNEGSAVVAEFYDVEGLEIVMWSIIDYFVLVKAADIVFDGHFREAK